MASIWNDASIQKLTELWARGWSAKIIAPELGVTRNAVIGKVFRLGLANRELTRTADAPKRPFKSIPNPMGSRVITRITYSNGHTPRVVSALEAKPYKLRCIEIDPRHVSLVDLKPNDCRYPYGDETVTFCGLPKREGSSYCGPHFALCTWIPPVRRAA